MNLNIFRAYDIRGNAALDLNDTTVQKIGYVLGEKVKSFGDNKIFVGHDSRLSRMDIFNSLVKGLNASGVEVFNLGLVPTPMLYYATKKGQFNHGVMITGSHNPKEDNGLKIVINDSPTSGLEIREEVLKVESLNIGDKLLQDKSFENEYLQEVKAQAALERPLKIVLDAGNGASGPLATKVFKEIGADVIAINEMPDGNFPNHHPDPSKEKNLKQIKESIIHESADFGFAFDGDGDRVGLITSSGKQISSDHIIMILCEYYLNLIKGPIVFDVKCSNELPKLISMHGGQPIMEKTGHFNIKKSIKRHNAVLGGEMSGHIFLNHNWYGFDDAIYTAAILSKILSEQSITLDEIVDKFPKTFSTPELNLDVDDNDKFEMVEKFISEMKFKDSEVNLIDGVRINKENCWGLLRASNTSPKFVLRFEGRTEEDLKIIKEEFELNLNRIFPDLNLEYS
ncbi:MAG: phosphomannomutase/phosphoglucomutase [SAR86 cluster bacterium]|uniref:phosphomannomutase n=1 Tax=SAR86 cluster bacterium TaxID=2030880 RepID=A0A937I820_9GAMM|nr:phosphomannomutase/phosphoglucomutase [SAR86 cluster bacterium]